MAANIPDMNAIHNLGKQFDTPKNVFDIAQKHYNKKAKTAITAHNKEVKQTAANRQKFAQSVTQGIKQGRTKFVQGQQQQQTAAKKAAQAHAAGVKSGRVAPAQGAAPRTFAMAPTPQAKAAAKVQAGQAKTMQQQRNFAHGQALTYQAAQFKTQQSQKNFAHGQAIQQQKTMDKKAVKGGPVNSSAPKAPSLSPAFSSPAAKHTPVKAKAIAPVFFSSQLTTQAPLAGPQGTTTSSFSSASTPAKPAPKPAAPSVTGSQFSNATPVKPKSTMPSFSSAPTTPKNLNPSFSDNSASAKPKPLGSTSISFSDKG